jgi:hypothetical protein
VNPGLVWVLTALAWVLGLLSGAAAWFAYADGLPLYLIGIPLLSSVFLWLLLLAFTSWAKEDRDDRMDGRGSGQGDSEAPQ